jgi:hypothetical protein
MTFPWRYVLTLGGAWLYDKLLRKRLPSKVRRIVDRFIDNPGCASRAPQQLQVDLLRAIRDAAEAKRPADVDATKARVTALATELARYMV